MAGLEPGAASIERARYQIGITQCDSCKQARQIAGGSWNIFGVMLESNLVEGRQDYVPGHQGVYGQSITDACISIEQTEPLLEELAKAQQLRGSTVPA